MIQTCRSAVTSVGSWFVHCSVFRTPGLLLVAGLLSLFQLMPISAQESPDLGPLSIDVRDVDPGRFKIGAARTDGPRDTVATFIRLRDELETALLDYPGDKTAAKAQHIEFLFDQLISLIDLSAARDVAKREVGMRTVAALLDIFGRVGLPDIKKVPDEDTFQDKGFAQYRIPDTPIRITRVESGPREREFLFNERVILVAPRFLTGIEREPLDSRLGIRSWSTALPQFTGPLIPNSLVISLPEGLLRSWMDTPIWKVVAILFIATLSILFFAQLHRVLDNNEPEHRINALLTRLLRPLALMALVVLLIPTIEHQINTSGVFSSLIYGATTLLKYIAGAWLFWLLLRLVAEFIILSPHIPDDSLDANMLRLVTGSIGAFTAIGMMAYCGNQLGLPVLSIVAGLGVGGLAIALAIRPTLENLIGGFILYLDKPVRVGDYCTFGDLGGTVESIGIRSTTLEALDQTLITIPNAQFADLQIVNWSKSDVQIARMIGLRYETDLDQLRFILAKFREMFHAHPKIDSNTARARFEDFGQHAQLISIRIFVKTRNWNEYYAVQEDVLFRIGEIVKEAGAKFAFPSQTLYLSRDQEPDTEGSELARREVAGWRRMKQFPFPRFASSKLEEIDATLRYPPPGSPDANATDEEFSRNRENLSADPLEEENNEPDKEQS